eukprot:2736986-Rhodomonas_salina.1
MRLLANEWAMYPATLCPVLAERMVLCCHCAMSGTDERGSCYAVSGTAVGYGAWPQYAVHGTEIEYGGTGEFRTGVGAVRYWNRGSRLAVCGTEIGLAVSAGPREMFGPAADSGQRSQPHSQ